MERNCCLHGPLLLSSQLARAPRGGPAQPDARAPHSPTLKPAGPPDPLTGGGAVAPLPGTTPELNLRSSSLECAKAQSSSLHSPLAWAWHILVFLRSGTDRRSNGPWAQRHPSPLAHFPRAKNMQGLVLARSTEGRELDSNRGASGTTTPANTRTLRAEMNSAKTRARTGMLVARAAVWGIILAGTGRAFVLRDIFSTVLFTT